MSALLCPASSSFLFLFLLLPKFHFSGYVPAVKITGHIFLHRSDGAVRQIRPMAFWILMVNSARGMSSLNFSITASASF